MTTYCASTGRLYDNFPGDIRGNIIRCWLLEKSYPWEKFPWPACAACSHKKKRKGEGGRGRGKGLLSCELFNMHDNLFLGSVKCQQKINNILCFNLLNFGPC